MQTRSGLKNSGFIEAIWPGDPLLDAMKIFGLCAVLLLMLVPSARADSIASKNKQGNRLFEQGKYQDAEKAYLEAQAGMPGRPELSYNLGNTLIKQKKYDQALQALGQAVSQGDTGLQARSYYNVGNALFDMGRLKEAAQSYIQALRINPADQDAKHNLELALRNNQEQKQDQPQQGSGQAQEPDQQKPQGGQREDKGKNEPKPQDKQGQPPQGQKEQKPANPQSSQSGRPEGSFSKERALQILDALQNQELAEQRKLLERQARKKATGRDW
jgi:Ca-activated chloride channel family protein